MIRALRINKVPLVDQVAKIRAALSGHPLSMVPESIKLATTAFETLRSCYGDEERVLALRIKYLKKTGQRPDAPMARVSWYTDLISKCQRLLELGEQSTDLARVAFSGDIFLAILNLFPEREMVKMGTQSLAHGKYTKERLEDIIKRLETKREESNYADKVSVQKEKDKPGGYGGAGGVNRGHSVHQASGFSENKDCKICQYLEARKPAPNHQNPPTHCSRTTRVLVFWDVQTL